jgi:hypothetical protein
MTYPMLVHLRNLNYNKVFLNSDSNRREMHSITIMREQQRKLLRLEEQVLLWPVRFWFFLLLRRFSAVLLDLLRLLHNSHCHSFHKPFVYTVPTESINHQHHHVFIWTATGGLLPVNRSLFGSPCRRQLTLSEDPRAALS